MIQHHPGDHLLASFAAGSLSPGPVAVVAAHAEVCADCRARVRALEAAGGALLERIEPAALAPDLLERTLALVEARDASRRDQTAAAPAGRLRARLPVAWPRGLRTSAATRWLPIAPGVRWSRITLATDAAANIYLLRVAAGKAMPGHGHRGAELTQVLCGAYDDGGRRIATGDFDETGDRVRHRPVVAADGECICLTTVEGGLAFDGPLARAVGSVLGM